jgi:hypothetical protein
MKKTKRWSLLRLALAALGLSTLMMDCNGVREDEVDCEQAVAYLQQCCPDFAQSETLQCDYSEGCGVTEPAISIPQSQCILAETCAQIVSSGLCGRAANLASPSTSAFQEGAGGFSDGAGGGPAAAMVCP